MAGKSLQVIINDVNQLCWICSLTCWNFKTVCYPRKIDLVECIQKIITFFLRHIYIRWMKESLGSVEMQNEDLISKARCHAETGKSDGVWITVT